MADTDFTPEEQTANTIIPQYNILPYNAVTNKYGFGDYGQRYNYLPLANQVSTLAKAGRRFALFASAQAILAGQKADLAGQAADSAGAERIAAQNAANAAYQSVSDAAAQVTLAANQVDLAAQKVTLASNQADRAKGYADALNIPALTPSVGGYFLKANSDGTAYEFGQVLIATASDIKNGTGTGFANAQTLGPVLKDIGPSPGDLLDSFKAPGTGSADWLETVGTIVSQIVNPGLFQAIGNQYNELGYLSQGSSNPNFQTPNELSTAYANNKIFILNYFDAAASGYVIDRIAISEDDGLTFTPSVSARRDYGGFIDVFYISPYYVALPKYSYSPNKNSGANELSAYSVDGKTWSFTQETTLYNAQDRMFYTADSSSILAFAANRPDVWRKNSGNGAFNRLSAVGLSGNLQSGSKSPVTFGNGIFLAAYRTTAGNVRIFRSTDKGLNWVMYGPSFNDGGCILRYVLGNFYALNKDAGTLYKSADGITWTTVFTTIPDVPLDIFTDGERILIYAAASRIYSIMRDNSLYRLKYTADLLATFFTSSSQVCKQSDGLLVAGVAANPFRTLRLKLIPDRNTEFQLPTITSSVAGAKKYIRGK